MGRSLKSWFRSPWLWMLAGLVFVLAVIFIAQPAMSSFASDMASGDDVVAVAAVTSDEQAHTAVSKPVSTLDSTQTHQVETTMQLVADTPSSDNCIACHTDKEKLKELAVEPEKVKSEEAEGEG